MNKIKTDPQIPFNVNRITMHKKIFNIDQFQMLVTSVRWVKGTLEVKVKIPFVCEIINKHMLQPNRTTLYSGIN